MAESGRFSLVWKEVPLSNELADTLLVLLNALLFVHLSLVLFALVFFLSLRQRHLFLNVQLWPWLGYLGVFNLRLEMLWYLNVIFFDELNSVKNLAILQQLVNENNISFYFSNACSKQLPLLVFVVFHYF